MTHPSEFIERVRRDDPRVPVIERGLLAAQLGTTVHDLNLLEHQLPRVVATLLDRSAAVVQTIGAQRLLEQLDAHEARRHPVDLEYPSADVTVARVPFDDGDTELTAALQHDLEEPLVVLEVAEREVAQLDVTETEALAYALLRLVQLHRSTELLNETEYRNQVIGTDNGPRRDQ